MKLISIKVGLLYSIVAYASAQSVSQTDSCYWTTTVIYGDPGTWISYSGFTSSSTTASLRSTLTTMNSIGGEPGTSGSTSLIGPSPRTSTSLFPSTSDSPPSSSTNNQASSSTSTASSSPIIGPPSPTSAPFVVQINVPNPTNLKLRQRDISYLTFVEGEAYLTSYEGQAAVFVLTATKYLLSAGSYVEPSYEQYGQEYTRPLSLPGAVSLQQTLALFDNRYGWSFDDDALMLGNASFYVNDIGRMLVFFGGEGQAPDGAAIAELGVAFVDGTASSTVMTSSDATSSSDIVTTSVSPSITPTTSDVTSLSATPTFTIGEISSSTGSIPFNSNSPGSSSLSSSSGVASSTRTTLASSIQESSGASSTTDRSTATTPTTTSIPATLGANTASTGLSSIYQPSSGSTVPSVSTQTATSILSPSNPLPPSSSSLTQISTVSSAGTSSSKTSISTSSVGTSSATVSVPVSQSTNIRTTSTTSTTRTVSTGSSTTTPPVLSPGSQPASSTTSVVSDTRTTSVSSLSTATTTQTTTSTSSRVSSQTSSSTLISTTTTNTTSTVRSTTSTTRTSSSTLSTATSTSASTPYPSKRGLAYTNVTTLVYYPPPSRYISWAYNYYSLPNASNNAGPYPSSQFRFIPLLFNDDPSLTSIWATNVEFSLANYGTDALFGFNEPDACFAGLSSCMPLNKSLQGYAAYMQPFANRTSPSTGQRVKIGSVAVTNAGQDGLAYLSQFLGNATQMNLTVDFLNLHWYASPYNIQYFKDYVTQAYNVTGGGRYPVWITEFGMDRSDYPAALVQDFLRNASRWCDETPWVERYAWFGNFNSENAATNMLLNADGSGLSPLGGVWRNYNGTN